MDIFKKNLIHNSDIPVKQDKIKNNDMGKILEAGRWAPSPFNSQPWEFLIIEDNTLREKAYQIIKQQSEDIQILKKFEKILLNSPGNLFILYNTTRMDPGKNAEKLGYICLGACMSNIYLSSSALNIKIESVQFFSEMKHIKNELKKLLKIPEHIDLIMVLGMWYISDSDIHDFTNKKSIENKSSTIYENKYPNRYIFKNQEQDIYILDDIFSLIRRRKSYRKKFLDENISSEHESVILKSILFAPSFLDESNFSRSFILVKDFNLRGKIAKFIQKSANELYMDDLYFAKMKEWIRFSNKDDDIRKDGIFINVFIKYLNVLLEFGMKIIDKSFFSFLKKIMVKNFAKAFFHDLVITSPELIGILHDSSKIKNTEEEYRMSLISIGSMIQNILLFSTSIGIGAQFLSILFDTEESKQNVIKELGLPPHLEIIDMIRIGYIDTDAFPPQYLSVQSSIRLTSKEIFHMNCYE